MGIKEYNPSQKKIGDFENALAINTSIHVTKKGNIQSHDIRT